MVKNKITRGIWHPFLLVSYSVLALYTFNLGEVELKVIFRPIIVMLFVVLCLLGFYRIIIKNWQRAGLLTTWSMFLCVTYGHFYNFLSGSNYLQILGHHRYLLPIWIFLFVTGSFLIIKTIKDPKIFSSILNSVTLILVLFSIVSISRYFISKSHSENVLNESAQTTVLQLNSPQNPPDIYYLLLDGYTRSDVLDQKFGFDNSDFQKNLENLGFYVADCSRSNYLYTHLTLPSLLNMDYVDSLQDQSSEKGELDNFFLNYKTKHNIVMASLQSIGYKTIAFETSYAWAQFSDADVLYKPVMSKFFMLTITKFEEMYLDTTLLFPLLNSDLLSSKNFTQSLISPNVQEKIRIEFTLDTLKDMPDLGAPQFVFAHLIIPHPPYIFTEKGIIPNLSSYDESWEEGELGQQGYIGNVQYINKEIVKVVDEILSQSEVDPIIIIQSDHGSVFFDRSMNFSAFYFPGNGNDMLYPSITPVNTFRVIFNQYFGTNLPLLPDVSYSGNYPNYEFVPIDETYPNCIQ